VDLRDAKSVKDNDASLYDLVVVGSGIKMVNGPKNRLNSFKKIKNLWPVRKWPFLSLAVQQMKKKNRPEGQEKYLEKWLKKT
jgi:menaquinone-dependent protoporphyrinogen oxidase